METARRIDGLFFMSAVQNKTDDADGRKSQKKENRSPQTGNEGFNIRDAQVLQNRINKELERKNNKKRNNSARIYPDFFLKYGQQFFKGTIVVHDMGLLR